MLPDPPATFTASACMESDTTGFVGVGRTPFLGADVGVRSPGYVRFAVGSGVKVDAAVGTYVDVGERVYLGTGVEVGSGSGVAELQARVMSKRTLITPNAAQGEKLILMATSTGNRTTVRPDADASPSRNGFSF